MIAVTRKLIGAPYLHQGRTPRGIDCVGVPIWVMGQLGVLPDHMRAANYGRLSNGELIKECERFCTRLDAIEPGCLIVIKWFGESEAGHVAIASDLGMIHAYRHHGGVREHGYRAKWIEWTDSFWRLPGVAG